jgi:hypothetical protein
MYVPAARERVRVVGRQGVYLVVEVDRKAACAHLLAVSANLPVEENYLEGVPFAQLFPHPDFRPSVLTGD